MKPPDGLTVAGLAPLDGRTLALIAPDEPRFWGVFTAAPEFADHAPDPLDRWSRRVIGGWAAGLGAEAVFPSDGPPYAPFTDWALATGRCRSSPVAMLVHERMGLFISFRGAIILPEEATRTTSFPDPCAHCDRPCLTACPASAFAEGYDVNACHAWLDGKDGLDCMNSGCRVRRACPISKGCGRLPEQSAWHMRQFHT
nr:ferredoxin [Paracoccus salsus]